MPQKNARLLPVLVIVSLLYGCSHKGEVEDLIEGNYANLKDGGSLHFDAYEESHTTEWQVRTFHASGIVKWDKPWYELAHSFEPFDGIPEIKVVKECKAMNDGVKFFATMYKGATDQEGSVRLNLPNVDYMTIEGFVKRFPKTCFVLPNGKLLGHKIDKATFKKNEKKAIRDGELTATTILKHMKDILPQVEKCAAFAFAEQNDESLKKYIDDCSRLEEEIKQSLRGLSDVLASLNYFLNFPVVKMRSTSIGNSYSRLLDAKKESDRLGHLIAASLANAKLEMNTRKSSGVMFFKASANNNTPVSVGQHNFVTPVDVGGHGTKSIKMGIGDVKVFDEVQ